MKYAPPPAEPTEAGPSSVGCAAFRHQTVLPRPSSVTNVSLSSSEDDADMSTPLEAEEMDHAPASSPKSHPPLKKAALASKELDGCTLERVPRIPLPRRIPPKYPCGMFVSCKAKSAGVPATQNQHEKPQLPPLPLPPPPPARPPPRRMPQQIFKTGFSRETMVERPRPPWVYTARAKHARVNIERNRAPHIPWTGTTAKSQPISCTTRTSRAIGAAPDVRPEESKPVRDDPAIQAPLEVRQRSTQPLCDGRVILALGVGQFTGWYLLQSLSSENVFWHHALFGSHCRPPFQNVTFSES